MKKILDLDLDTECKIVNTEIGAASYTQIKIQNANPDIIRCHWSLEDDIRMYLICLRETCFSQQRVKIC